MGFYTKQLRQADAYSKGGRTIEEVERQLGYSVEVASDDLLAQGFSYVVQTPCGCHACDDGVQQGHFACETPHAALLQAEKDGLVTRHLDGSTWRWFVC